MRRYKVVEFLVNYASLLLYFAAVGTLRTLRVWAPLCYRLQQALAHSEAGYCGFLPWARLEFPLFSWPAQAGTDSSGVIHSVILNCFGYLVCGFWMVISWYREGIAPEIAFSSCCPGLEPTFRRHPYFGTKGYWRHVRIIKALSWAGAGRRWCFQRHTHLDTNKFTWGI